MEIRNTIRSDALAALRRHRAEADGPSHGGSGGGAGAAESCGEGRAGAEQADADEAEAEQDDVAKGVVLIARSGIYRARYS